VSIEAYIDGNDGIPDIVILLSYGRDHAGDLHWEIRRFGQATRPAHGVDHFAAHLMKLAHAMWIHARGFAPAPDGGIRQIPAADPGVTALSDRQIASVDPRHAPGSTGPTRGEEEEVLASPACVRGKTMTDRDQAPGANRAPVESAVSHTPAGDRPLEVSHAHMNAAHRKGQTVPFAQAVPWPVRYDDSW
jgi:hypothetical protein